MSTGPIDHSLRADVGDREDEEYDGLTSSAASCIRFSIPTSDEQLGNVNDDMDRSNDDNGHYFHFNPVYTHQIFPNEYIPNFRPMISSTLFQNQPSSQRQHPSFQFPSQYGLLIQIRLVPSCTACTVCITVQTQPPPLPEEICANNTNHQNSIGDDDDTTSHTMRQQSSKKQKIGDNAVIDNEFIQGSIEKILWEQLQSFVPPIVRCTLRIRSTHCDPSPEGDCGPGAIMDVTPDTYIVLTRPQLPSMSEIIPLTLPYYLPQPYGTLLQEYTPANTTFCMTICPGIDCADYCTALQTLAYYYIENASDMNINDPSWKVLFVFRKHEIPTVSTSSTTTTYCYSFVGYMTLYYFENPFRKPKSGTIVRICQVLILPPYQRQKHGQHMLHALYKYCDTDTSIVEVNVEDPVPAFTYLRLLVDYERYRKHFPNGFPPRSSDSTAVTIRDEEFCKIRKNHDALSRCQVALKTTMVQIQMIYEIDQLLQLQQFLRETTDIDEENVDRRYRLMVKQRLYDQNKEFLDETNKKQQLDIMYRKLRKQYEHILVKTIGATS